MLAAAGSAAGGGGVAGYETDNFLPFFPATLVVHILFLRRRFVGPQKVNKSVSSVAAAAAALPDHLILRGGHGGRKMGFLDFAEADDDSDEIHENLSEFLVFLDLFLDFSLLLLLLN